MLGITWKYCKERIDYYNEEYEKESNNEKRLEIKRNIKNWIKIQNDIIRETLNLQLQDEEELQNNLASLIRSLRQNLNQPD